MDLMLLLALLFHAPALFEAQETTRAERPREETVQSAALGREMEYRVLLPDGYGSSPRRYPVLYLLRGLGGSYTDWTTRTNLAEYSRTVPLVIVMPDAADAWYTNSSEGSEAYEHYILQDGELEN